MTETTNPSTFQITTRLALDIAAGKVELTEANARQLFEAYRKNRGFTEEMAVKEVGFRTGAPMKTVWTLLGY